MSLPWFHSYHDNDSTVTLTLIPQLPLPWFNSYHDNYSTVTLSLIPQLPLPWFHSYHDNDSFHSNLDIESTVTFTLIPVTMTMIPQLPWQWFHSYNDNDSTDTLTLIPNYHDYEFAVILNCHCFHGWHDNHSTVTLIIYTCIFYFLVYFQVEHQPCMFFYVKIIKGYNITKGSKTKDWRKYMWLLFNPL